MNITSNEYWKNRIRGSIQRTRGLRFLMEADPRPSMQKYLRKSLMHQQAYTRELYLKMGNYIFDSPDNSGVDIYLWSG